MEFAKDSLGPKRLSGLRLEEIESSTLDGKPVWLITLSNESPSGWEERLKSLSYPSIGAEPNREYKVFTVEKDNGEVLSMKIRMLAIPN